MGKCWKNVKIVNIFWDILDKRKGNLDQECVKRGLDSSPSFGATFQPAPP